MIFFAALFYGEDGEIEHGGSTETKNNSLISIDYQKTIWSEGGYEKILNKLPKNLKKYSSFWKFPSSKELNGKKFILLLGHILKIGTHTEIILLQKVFLA